MIRTISCEGPNLLAFTTAGRTSAVDPLRQEVRLRFARIDHLVSQGVSRLEAARRVGFPDGAWGMIGGRGPDARWVRWELRNPACPDRQRMNYAHVTVDREMTVCGKPIPTDETHKVVYDRPGHPCRTCTRGGSLVGRGLARRTMESAVLNGSPLESGPPSGIIASCRADATEGGDRP